MEMAGMMRSIASETKKDRVFYISCAEKLEAMDENDFAFESACVLDAFSMYSLEYRVPELRREQVMLDSRLVHIEKPEKAKCHFILSVTDPFKKNCRIEVPVATSRNSLRRLSQYRAAGSLSYSVTKKGKVRVQWAYTRSNGETCGDAAVGVDTGITDCLYTSEGSAFGTMAGVIGFYKGAVEPSFAGLSGIRNKKRAISHYLRTHKGLPPEVGRSLIRKMDRLEKQARTTNAPYRKKRHYYQMLDHEVKQAVDGYVSSIGPGTLTVLEQLDIKQFKKSRRLNGELSVFARGRLQEKLMDTLEWKGYPFLEVPPEYTSQACPACACLDKKNRSGKKFLCTCCGYEDDADHAASLNIHTRGTDEELIKISLSYPYHGAARERALEKYYREKHSAWEENRKKTETAETA